MQVEPSIKGAALMVTHLRVLELLENGRLSRDALEARLSPSALGLLDQKLEPSLWYSLEASECIRQVLVEVDAGGQTPDEYQRRTGFEGGAALVKGMRGRALKTFVDTARDHKSNLGETMVRMGQLIFNFGTWRFDVQPDKTWAIVFEDDGVLPELTRYASEGFIQALVSRDLDQPVRVRSERPEPNRIVFREA